jgi:hypothetical protein
MAVETRAFAFEDRPSAAGVSVGRDGALSAKGADVRDDAGDIGGVELMRRHGGSGNSGDDHARELLVGGGTAEAAGAEVHSGDGIAVGTVAEAAIGGVEPGAALDLGLAVLLACSWRDAGRKRGEPVAPRVRRQRTI